ncbi:uncharacterized protein [Nicotiana sylvestris]|uniref:tRNA pseudouridine(38/39) synthase n=1 Tax=Nicotiana sylvestris TaxID=4096 RepID=A0A1U7VNT8_NICSY|nr:PREDICTED: tRNA pseudouridine(38/39) synthase [Nicotiana sylvestris]XP_016503560.1 PREDICTED: tRNA pseudouridine(38/39) synthase-like [Nicotiana tabacum]
MDLVASLQSELETLRSRIKELESENVKLSARLSHCSCQETKEKSNGSLEKNGVLDGHGKKKNKLRDLGCGTMVMHQFPKRYVALKVMYFGPRFYGFASEAQMDPTVEGELFKALKRTRLIFGDKRELQYSRCGRTDKGVSSVGQVISLFLRSKHRESRGDNKYSGEISVEESCGEMDYVRLLNQVLPNDIRIMGWSPIPVGFSARFSCLSRVYKYFFWHRNLNITAMETAAEKFLGEHDFRNFCKMDAGNVHNYRRHIISFEILPFNESYKDDQLMIMKIKGSAFLWHQIRCMVAVLFLIGQGLESPNVIDALLDIERTPRKPQFLMAPEIPLVLQSCEFEGLKFICSSDAKQALNEHLERECRSYKLQAAIFHEAMLSSSSVEIDNNISSDRTKKKEASHTPLLSRPTEPSYEERRKKLDAGARTRR